MNALMVQGQPRRPVAPCFSVGHAGGRVQRASRRGVRCIPDLRQALLHLCQLSRIACLDNHATYATMREREATLLVLLVVPVSVTVAVVGIDLQAAAPPTKKQKTKDKKVWWADSNRLG